MPKDNQTLGRCHSCDRAYCWSGSTPLGVVRCTQCGGPLRQTTRQLRAHFHELSAEYLRSCRTKARPTPEQLTQAVAYVRAYMAYFSDRNIDAWQTRLREYEKLKKLCPYEPQLVTAIKQAKALVKKESKPRVTT